MMILRQKKLPAASTLAILISSALFVLWGGRAVSATAGDQGPDAPPSVKITSPGSGSTYSWGSLVNYSVVVSYHGKSTEYQEIPSSEVLLKATYVPDLSRFAEKPTPAPAGVLDIARSNCLGCHEFKARAMGPSFAAIAERYPENHGTVDTLTRHIRDGSTGVWGAGSMPPHAGMSTDQIHAIVLWILQDAASPAVSYYVGTEGAIRMQATGRPPSTAGMILTASYTSPLVTAASGQAPHGEDTVIVHGK